MMQFSSLTKKQKMSLALGALVILFGGAWLAFGRGEVERVPGSVAQHAPEETKEEGMVQNIPVPEPPQPIPPTRSTTAPTPPTPRTGTQPQGGQPYVQPGSGAQPVTNQGTPTIAPSPTPHAAGVSPAQPVTNQPTPTIAPPAPQPSTGASSGGTMSVRPQTGPGNLQPTVQQNNSTYPQFQAEYEVAYFKYTGGSPLYCSNNPCQFSFRSNGKYYVDGVLKTTLSAEKISVITNHVNQTSYASIRQRSAPTVGPLSPSYGCSQQSGKITFTFTLTNQQTEVIDGCQHQISNTEEPFKSLEYIRSVFP